ncbi:N-acetyl-gamma-glutamyl-phosphate reductase [Caldalkalibacillus thermarum]|uniref:N-acetyl-gamma-glutamyl-phosphate reductase n=1 Tax=Caldalkalibacillus thermarum TaxID=296745 RepID=UPI00166673EB|nr:N-acetyl-gamma-glutamyl-phosphate reductase [Caldalkalibacillus thermarum]GGK31787.1 N-acetyl-gamma-glutamyl-phosphate reductase [Caldalkalibacillus thermarum]
MKVAVIGGTGYGGVELIRLLAHHPHAELSAVLSHTQSGKDLVEVYPHLTGIVEQTVQALDVEQLAETHDLVFLATPSGVSKDILPQLVEKGIRCIDLAGDFRLKDPQLYPQWYHHEPASDAYLQKAVYGLSEIYREEIAQAKFIANPGCYPTAALLGLIPILKAGWIDPHTVIIDAKSGVSGAGRKQSLATHFSETNENLKVYKLGVHQHIPEIEQILSNVGQQEVKITFATHLVPMTRGIMCTMYVQLNEGKTTKEIIDLYHSFYERDAFVRIRPEGVWPATKEVYGSNYCDIGFAHDQRTGRLVIVSVIDNLVKGAAGQAIQNMNIMNNWDETTGLNVLPVYP